MTISLGSHFGANTGDNLGDTFWICVVSSEAEGDALGGTLGVPGDEVDGERASK